MKTFFAIGVIASLACLATAENVGQRIGDFFTDMGRGIEKAVGDVADGVNRLVMDNEDLDLTRRANNQKAIDAYKRGEINESQLQTALWINQYEYQQAIDDRIRMHYNGGNTYPGGYPSSSNNGNYGTPGYPGYNGYGTSGYNGYNQAAQYSNNYGGQQGNGWSNQAQAAKIN